MFCSTLPLFIHNVVLVFGCATNVYDQQHSFLLLQLFQLLPFFPFPFKSNNSALTLQWVTASENIKHSYSDLGRDTNKDRMKKPIQGRERVRNGVGGKFSISPTMGRWKRWKTFACAQDAADAAGCRRSQNVNSMMRGERGAKQVRGWVFQRKIQHNFAGEEWRTLDGTKCTRL